MDQNNHFGPFWPEERHFGPFRSASCTLAIPDSIYTTNLYRDTFAEVLGAGVVGTLPNNIGVSPRLGKVSFFRMFC